MTASHTVAEKSRLLLTCGTGGASSNILEFSDHYFNVFGKEYGRQSEFLMTNNRYQVPATVEEDYTPTGARISKEGLETLRVESEKIRMEEVRLLKSKAPKLYHSIISVLSDESIELMKSVKCAEWEAAQLSCDPFELWEIIRYTHFTHAFSGGKESLKDHDLVKSREQFASLKQAPGVKIAAFLQTFRNQLKMLESLGEPKLSEKQSALTFLAKLDSIRYGRMNMDLQNAANSGIAYPATLSAAFQLASAWKTSAVKESASAGGLQSVFVLCDDMDSMKIAKQQGKAIKGKKQVTMKHAADNNDVFLTHGETDEQDVTYYHEAVY